VAMRTTDYLINAVFVLIVFPQARERELDRRSAIIPLAIVAYVAHLYVRSIPTAGNDVVLIAALGIVGLSLGVASGFATHVRAGENGLAARLNPPSSPAPAAVQEPSATGLAGRGEQQHSRCATGSIVPSSDGWSVCPASLRSSPGNTHPPSV